MEAIRHALYCIDEAIFFLVDAHYNAELFTEQCCDYGMIKGSKTLAADIEAALDILERINLNKDMADALHRHIEAMRKANILKR